MLAVAKTDFCGGPQNKISHPGDYYRELVQAPVLSVYRINYIYNQVPKFVLLFSWICVPKVWI